MSNGSDYITGLLNQHYAEAANGVVEKAPSRLSRGEGTEKEYYILKIDLVGSTGLLMRRQKSTYLKVAHTFLSTIDKIAQQFGADPDQMEYAGDSVLAYFPASSVSAENIIAAACYARKAVMELKKLDQTLGKLDFKCKIVLHHATLLVAKIGPRANSITTAIGHPIHMVSKIEKDISPNTGRATNQFYQQVPREHKIFLAPIYKETQVAIPHSPPPTAPQGLIGTSPRGLFGTPTNSLLSAGLQTPRLGPRDGIVNSLLNAGKAQQPQYRIERSVIYRDLKWGLLFRELNLLP